MGGNKCWISKRKYLKDLWLRILGPKMLDTATRLRSSQGKALLIFGDVYYVIEVVDESVEVKLNLSEYDVAYVDKESE